ncbi:MAG: hypothetical protein AAF843_11035 [Bacteroidota bacterium]
MAILKNIYVQFLGTKTFQDMNGFNHSYKDFNIYHTIYLANDQQGIVAFLKPKNKKRRKKKSDNVSYELLDDNVSSDFFGMDYDKVIDFADQEDLDMTNIEDLIQIMEYYASIK